MGDRRNGLQEAPPSAAKEPGNFVDSVFGKMTKDPEWTDRIRPTLILGLLYFKEPLAIEELRVKMKERMSAFWRFRSRLVVDKTQSPFRDVHFEELSLEALDMAYHVSRPPAPPGGGAAYGDEELDAYLSSMYSSEFLDPDAPLWRWLYFDAMKDGRYLLLFVGDHCLGDGAAMVNVLFSILDDPPSAGGGEAHKVAKRAALPSVPLCMKATVSCFGYFQALLNPMLPNDPENRLKLKNPRRPTPAKRCSQSASISLAKAKEVKAKFPGATLNDVFLATMTLTLRRYYEAKGDSVRNIRGSFPINMRSSGGNCANDLRNHFTIGTFPFDFGYRNRCDAVWRTKRSMDHVKYNPAPFLIYHINRVGLPWAPKSMHLDLIFDNAAKATAMLSNVPGPQSPVRLLGQTLDDIMFYAFSGVGVYFGVMTYDGKVYATVATDPTCEEKPVDITKFWVPEFEALYEEAMSHSDTAPRPATATCATCFGMFRSIFP